MAKKKSTRKKKKAAVEDVAPDRNLSTQPGDNDPPVAIENAKPVDAAEPADAADPVKNNELAVVEQESGTAVSLFPIVGLGASAGGLEALEEFFRKMPSNSGMAFIVVVHQSAKHVSLLSELLNKCTEMRVLQISDGMTIEPETVYVVPPGMNLELLNGTLHLTDIPPNHLSPLPIDYFFFSLADDCRERAVAIVLSGTGTDGTAGIARVKDAAGLTFVQSIESAKFSGMPQSAINSGLADDVLAPGKMPDRLIRFVRLPRPASPQLVHKPTGVTQESLAEILLLLRRRCGHDFSGYKYSTIGRRIERRKQVHQITEARQYLRLLAEHPPEAEILFKELLIGVTSMFRDPWAFDALAKNAIVPMMKNKTGNAIFRVWVPGCSTGEEAYSLAILLHECMDRLNLTLNVQIFATDLDNDAVTQARTGLIPASKSADVSRTRLKRYFSQEDGHYRLRKDLRDYLVFAPQNVIYDPPFTKLDLVSCRNLLIYLRSDLQRKLLMLFHYSLNPGGCLFLGTSETIGKFSDLFATVDQKAKVFRRNEVAPRPERQVKFPIKVVPKMMEDGMPAPRKNDKPIVRLDDVITETLLSQLAPPTVVVDENGEILHVHGRTGKFLELAPGDPKRNIFAMARDGLEIDLSAAMRKAARQDQPVIHPNVRVRDDHDSITAKLTVQRITTPDSISGLLRVSFEEVSDEAPPVAKPKSGKPGTHREMEIELELQHMRESLQRSIEELDASNEEMKSTNEELQSTNEELQSTNEELETSKEELQSLNEELQTINAEYQEKNSDLSRANDDMNNLLNSTQIATVFLDSKLCIKRFTERANEVIHLISSDIGRPLSDLTSTLRYENLVADAGEVLKTLVFKELDVQTDDGRWLLMRILPYRTFDDKIDGLVMTFVDIDELKRTQIKVQQTRQLAENIEATVREPLLILDEKLLVKSANRAFYRRFDVESQETIGALIYDLGNGQWNIPALRELLEEILPSNKSFEGFEVEYDFPGIGKKRMLLNARRVDTADDEPDLILLAIEDVTNGS